MRGKWLALVVRLALLLVATPAGAGVSYSYVAEPSFPATFPGESVTVKLYLLETLTGNSTSLINGDGGMLGVSMKIVRASGGPLNAATLGAVTLNAADFNGPSAGEESPTAVRFTEGIGPGGAPGVMTGNGGPDAVQNAIFLGTVAVTAGQGIGPTVFNLLPYDNLGGNTLTLNSFRDLDSSSTAPPYTGTGANPTSFSVGVIPEPASALPLAVGAACVVRRRSGRRRRPVKQIVASAGAMR